MSTFSVCFSCGEVRKSGTSNEYSQHMLFVENMRDTSNEYL